MIVTTIARMRAAEIPLKVTCLACGLSWVATIDTLAAPCVHCGDDIREE